MGLEVSTDLGTRAGVSKPTTDTNPLRPGKRWPDRHGSQLGPEGGDWGALV